MINQYEQFSSEYLLRSAQEAGKKYSGNKPSRTKSFMKAVREFNEIKSELYRRGFSSNSPTWYLQGMEVEYDPDQRGTYLQSGTVESSDLTSVRIKLLMDEQSVIVNDMSRLRIKYI